MRVSAEEELEHCARETRIIEATYCGEVVWLEVPPNMLQKFDSPSSIDCPVWPPWPPAEIVLGHPLLCIWNY